MVVFVLFLCVYISMQVMGEGWRFGKFEGKIGREVGVC